MNLLRKKRYSTGEKPTSSAFKALSEKQAASPTSLLRTDLADSPRLGTGRAIPILQGFLNKKQDGSVKRDWKRKYVTLTTSQLVYYSTLNDYRSNENGKAMDLRFCTVKLRESVRAHTTAGVPLQNRLSNGPAASDSPTNGQQSLPWDAATPEVTKNLNSAPPSPSLPHAPTIWATPVDSPQSPALVNFARTNTQNCSRERTTSEPGAGISLLTPSSTCPGPSPKDTSEMRARTASTSLSNLAERSKVDIRIRMNSFSRGDKPKVRKRSNTISSSRPVSTPQSPAPILSSAKASFRIKLKDELHLESYEFKLVSLNGKTWSFEAFCEEDFESWTASIKGQIQGCLERSFSDKEKTTDKGVTESIQKVAGNTVCADCLQRDPEWASLNFGSLICIECSAVHRNLGAHVSRVRSLSLDEWVPEVVEVMLALGNECLISLYECDLSKYDDRRLPVDATRENREAFIREKYIGKEFLKKLPEELASLSAAECLQRAITGGRVKDVFHVLAHCSQCDVNTTLTDGASLLHKVAAKDSCVLTQLLMWSGADTTAKDKKGRLPLDIAGSKCKVLLKQYS